MSLAQDTKDQHRSQETRKINSGDWRLRRFGFTIHSREKGKEPVWSRRGALFSQMEAEHVVKREILEAERMGKK